MTDVYTPIQSAAGGCVFTDKADGFKFRIANEDRSHVAWVRLSRHEQFSLMRTIDRGSSNQALAFIRQLAKEDCFRRSTEFRGSCGRDGAKIDTWCWACRAKAMGTGLVILTKIDPKEWNWETIGCGELGGRRAHCAVRELLELRRVFRELRLIEGVRVVNRRMQACHGIIPDGCGECVACRNDGTCIEF